MLKLYQIQEAIKSNYSGMLTLVSVYIVAEGADCYMADAVAVAAAAAAVAAVVAVVPQTSTSAAVK